MKKIIVLLLFAFSLFGVSCSRRETIPDGELAMIFRDAFLTNAYVYDMKTMLDSVQVYQPIFDKYGYSVEDVAYTVGSFSKRKSARLSDVVERAIKMLEEGAATYKLETTILDSIDHKAMRQAQRAIYQDSIVKFHSLRDTTDIKIEFDSLVPGKYHITFDYEVDSLDNNRSSYRAQTWVEPAGTTTKKGVTTSYLRRHSEGSYERTLTFDTLTHNFVLMLAESYEMKRKPHVTFRNLRIEHTPPTAEAVERFYRDKLNIRIFADDFFTSLRSTDSL